MPTDIVLNDNKVVIEGGAGVSLRAADLKLAFAKHLPKGAGVRRALVHDTSDALVMNYGPDYRGGVEIRGQVSFPGHVVLHFPPPPKSTAGKKKAAASGFEKPTLLTGTDPKELDESSLYADAGDDPVLLAVEIKRLRYLILRLNERLTAAGL